MSSPTVPPATANAGLAACAAGAIDPARWALLSPWLDKLLDADAAARTALLAQAAAQEPALAADLASLLHRLDLQAGDAFMQTPAPHAGLAARGDAASQAPGAASAIAAEIAAGQRIGAYTVERLLGQGGMGSVWLARRTDGRYDGHVAIKFLHGGLAGRGGAQRFAREGQILARLDHPHIARLLDAGATADDGGQPYLVLEFVPGLPVDEYVRTQALDTRATVGLFMDVLAAVAHAHERLTLHRDLKPSNILVTAQGQVKLLDFGIAKLVSDALDTAAPQQATQLTQQAGRAYTLRYAAPEQVDQGEPTTATDVYALGVLLHELLTGGLHPTASSDKTTQLAQLQALVKTTPRRTSEAVARHGGAQAKKLTRVLQGDLDTIIGRALKKQPAERYRNAAELADDLRRYLQHEPITARPDSTVYRLSKFLRRNPWGVAAVGSVMLALGAGTALALQSAQKARQQSAQAESLVEFMLEDLRPKLESVNRLDVMDAVGAKVLAYYEQHDASTTDAAALGRRGQALTLVGRMAQKRGQLPDAERILSQAVASLAEVARREPSNAPALLAHGASLNALAVVQRQRGELPKAEASNRDSLALHRRAYALRPDAVTLRKLVESQVNLADFYNRAGRPADALPLHEEAHTGALRLVQATPSAWALVANIRNGMADAQYQLGRMAESIATGRTQLQALAQVPAAEQGGRPQALRAAGLTRVGISQLATGQLADAADSFSDAVAQTVAVSTREPGNAEWLSDLVRRRLFLSETLFWAGRQAQAQAELQLAQADLQRLLQRPGLPLEWRLRRGFVLQQRALLNPGDAQLTTDLQAFADDFAGPAAAGLQNGAQLTPAQRRDVAQVVLQLGNTRALHQQTAAAQTAWRQGLVVLQPPSQGSSASAKAIAAQLHWRLGDTAQAQALVADIDNSEYRHPRYVALRREMQQQAPAPRQTPTQHDKDGKA